MSLTKAGFETWQERVIEERLELMVRVEKLSAFHGTQAFYALDIYEQADQLMQLKAMRTYLQALDNRVQRFTH
jgi:hypothetical protein